MPFNVVLCPISSLINTLLNHMEILSESSY